MHIIWSAVLVGVRVRVIVGQGRLPLAECMSSLEIGCIRRCKLTHPLKICTNMFSISSIYKRVRNHYAYVCIYIVYHVNIWCPCNPRIDMCIYNDAYLHDRSVHMCQNWSIPTLLILHICIYVYVYIHIYLLIEFKVVQIPAVTST